MVGRKVDDRRRSGNECKRVKIESRDELNNDGKFVGPSKNVRW